MNLQEENVRKALASLPAPMTETAAEKFISLMADVKLSDLESADLELGVTARVRLVEAKDLVKQVEDVRRMLTSLPEPMAEPAAEKFVSLMAYVKLPALESAYPKLVAGARARVEKAKAFLWRGRQVCRESRRSLWELGLRHRAPPVP